ncbi:unnamed protein product [Fusarium venenatum]|uniref:Uncharacterized protein n=1 Tax=Fusarium venenatum TaxID=56646 RepID=A0A2L2TVR6_9HYPO|nr:uncharacterized protein FVRRES_08553 [Fusarium venenatum]CEI68476.1 unnamed protein product [Fusarium venenatum]
MPRLPCLAYPTSLVDEVGAFLWQVLDSSDNLDTSLDCLRRLSVELVRVDRFLLLHVWLHVVARLLLPLAGTNFQIQDRAARLGCRLCLLLSFSIKSILTVVDLRSRLRLMVKSRLHMTTHLLQLGDSAWTSPAGLHVLSKAPPRATQTHSDHRDKFSNQALTHAGDEESRSATIYFDKLLSGRFLTVSFELLWMIPTLDSRRMENGEGYIISPFPLIMEYREYRISNLAIAYIAFAGLFANVIHTLKLQNPP